MAFRGLTLWRLSKSPVIDNKAELAAGLYSTKGGDVITIKGVLPKENVEVWVGETKSPKMSTWCKIWNLATTTTQPVSCLQVRSGNKLRIVLPSIGNVASTESEFATVNYKPPSACAK